MIAEKLRKAVLQAAMEGKLTEQLESDGSALDLVTDAKQIKESLNDKLVPINWIVTTISNVGDVIGGGTPKTTIKEYWNGNIPWITPADMSNKEGIYISHGKRFITQKGLNKSSARLLPKGSILLSSRAPIGYVAIASNPITTNQGFKSIVPNNLEMNKYIYYCLMSIVNELQELGTGTTFKEISGATLKKVLIPIPPLAEQKRIVEKLEVLLAEIDKLEQDEKALKELEDKFPEKLKTSILQAAIEGKLVDNSTHESAVNELDKKTQRLYFSNKDKYRLPFAIPKTWISMPIFERYYFVKTGLSNYEGEKKYFSTGSIKEVFKPEGLYTFENRPSRANRLVLKGDIIEAKMSNTIKTTIVNEELDNQLVSTGFFQIRTNNETTTKYIYYLLQSPYFINIKNELSSGTTQKAINDTNLRKIIVPIPPLEEQKRIVEKLDELFSVDLLNGI